MVPHEVYCQKFQTPEPQISQPGQELQGVPCRRIVSRTVIGDAAEPLRDGGVKVQALQALM